MNMGELLKGFGMKRRAVCSNPLIDMIIAQWRRGVCTLFSREITLFCRPSRNSIGHSEMSLKFQRLTVTKTTHGIDYGRDAEGALV